jgi:hypothetical protein
MVPQGNYLYSHQLPFKNNTFPHAIRYLDFQLKDLEL